MSTQLEQVRSAGSIELAKKLGSGILKEKPDSRNDIVTIIAGALDKVAAMFQIPNWNTTLAVDLAEWVYLTYQYEELDTIINAITHPSLGESRVYRLTPDVIAEWMGAALEKQAEEREKQHNKEKKTPPTLKEVLTDEQMKALADTVANSKIKAIPKLTPEEQKFWGGERPKAVSTNYKNHYTQEEMKLKEAITKAGREFYRNSKYTYASLTIYQVNEYDVLAGSQEQANEIFNNARQSLTTERADKTNPQ